DEIDSEDQVLIADLPDEYGLWYRLAPLCYLGGTFMGLPNRNPFEPAALGSAVLHGPHPCFFAPNFDALSAAGASRVLQVPEELGPALVSLSAPDQCAQLAHAAWDVSSQGAEVTDRVIGLIRRAVRDGA
ncbi:MAG: 3-deoxy-D-manno-octulosonic acid transferase, partial [Pseudomonadota bacterium]